MEAQEGLRKLQGGSTKDGESRQVKREGYLVLVVGGVSWRADVLQHV